MYSRRWSHRLYLRHIKIKKKATIDIPVSSKARHYSLPNLHSLNWLLHNNQRPVFPASTSALQSLAPTATPTYTATSALTERFIVKPLIEQIINPSTI